MKGDEASLITYVGDDKQSMGSVLDLVLIVDRGFESGIESMEIVKRVESDHLLVAFKLASTMSDERGIINTLSLHKDRVANEKIVWRKGANLKYEEELEGVIASDGSADSWQVLAR